VQHHDLLLPGEGTEVKFTALLPVRDEADIIGQCLENLLIWADAIYVFDTGSVDDTWEIVQDYAGKDKRVVPLRKDPVYFSETRLRGWMFHQARKTMRSGDWFLRVDADEFHHIAPPEFVKTRMAKHETIAYHQYYNFRLTCSELKAWEAGKETLEHRKRPIEERRRWFTPSHYSEPRLCQYRDTMQWPPTVSFPFNAGFVARERLPIRHYPHRDPIQLERRCRLRAVMMADKENRSNWTRPELHHWAESEWRKFITPINLAELRFWKLGTKLPEYNFVNHLARPHVRVIQRIVHCGFLSVLDGMRKRWPEEAFPQKIPEDVTMRLQLALR
jgi:glycosyltransferase involved in cell wall biosynthesis